MKKRQTSLASSRESQVTRSNRMVLTTRQVRSKRVSIEPPKNAVGQWYPDSRWLYNAGGIPTIVVNILLMMMVIIWLMMVNNILVGG